jgi:hypothetical protein
MDLPRGFHLSFGRRGNQQIDSIPSLAAFSYRSLVAVSTDPPMAVIVSYGPAHSRMLDNHDALEHRNRRLMAHHHQHHHQQNIVKCLPTSSLPLSPESARHLRSRLAHL